MIKHLITISNLLLAGAMFAGTAPAPYTPPVAPAALSLLSYNTFEVGWLHSEFDSPLLDSSDGVGAQFSFSPVEHFYLAAGGAWESINSSDAWLANVGLGGYVHLGSNIDFVTEVGAAFYGISNGDIIDSDNDGSAYVRPHLRARWGSFETHVGAAWTNLDISNEWAGFARFYLGVMENVDLSAGISAGKDEYTLNVGMRLRY